MKRDARSTGLLSPGLIGPLVILLATGLALAPEFLRGCSCGHDFDFHLVSWLDALEGWRNGIPYPHWTPSANWGTGEPRFVFYPPLTWMMGAALGAILPWQFVPIALTFLLLAGTGLGTWALARELMDEGPATLAGCVSIFAGYTLFVAYERTAFAELAGGLWIALLLKFALRERTPGGEKLSTWHRAFDGSAAPLALVIAGAWLSNPTVGVMACYLLAAVAVTAALATRSWAPVLRALVATPLGLGLAAVYLFPVAGEQGWADLNQVNLSPGQTLENNWLFARHANPVLAFHDQVLFQASLIAVAMIAVAVAAMVVCKLRGTMPGGRRWWIPLALIPPVVLFLLFPVSLPLWNALPKLRFLQFPWRWLLVLEAPIGIFVALAVWPRRARARWRGVVGATAALVFVGLALGANRWFFQVCDDEDSVPGAMATWRSGAGFPGTDEYEPKRADNTLVATRLPDACLVADPDVTLGVAQKPAPDADPDDDLPPPLWDPQQDSCDQIFLASPVRAADHAERFEVLAMTDHAGYLVLKLRSYPAWQVRVNGRNVGPLPQRDDGLMAVPVPAGPLKLTANWITTPDVMAGRWISVLALLLLIGLWLQERKSIRGGLSSK